MVVLLAGAARPLVPARVVARAPPTRAVPARPLRFPAESRAASKALAAFASALPADRLRSALPPSCRGALRAPLPSLSTARDGHATTTQRTTDGDGDDDGSF